MEEQQNFKNQVRSIYRVLLTMLLFFGIIVISIVYLVSDPTLSFFKKEEVAIEYVSVPSEDDYDKIVNGLHVGTGLIDAVGLMEVVNNCTICHSAKLVMQNRMNKERWIETIRWMQKTQNLGDLGKNEEIIVNYLATNYPPINKGRRETLLNIEWYVLEN